MKRIILFVIMMLLFSFPSFAALKPNGKAPDFLLRDGTGKEISLIDVTGSVKNGKTKGLVLSFFASWCVPCRNELLLVNSLTDELQGKGITVVLVDVKEDFATINALVAELNVHKPLVLSDRDGKTAEKYQVRFFPTTFFVRPDGTIADVIFGEIKDAAELRSSAGKIFK